jgi:hypothetical protein
MTAMEPQRAGRLGRLPNDPSKPRLKLAPHLDTAVPPNPAVVDWLSRVDSWPMYGNDRYGDCVWAMIGHLIEAFSTYGGGSTVTVPEQALLDGYTAVTGFDPSDPSTDNGTVIQDALAYWLKVGVAGHKILAYAEVDIHNQTEVDAAINVFGALCLGVNLPNSAMDQFNAGQPWTVVTPDGGIDGGHAVPVGYYSTPGETVRVVTWARTQDVADAWWAQYVEEAWVVVAPEWLDATGHSPEGVDLHGLGEDFAVLTGKPNPFPVQPTPGPTPVPAPPVVDPADQALVAALRPWLREHHVGDNHRAVTAVRTWMATKGLS